MKKRAFDFASIGFRPYAETGEFVTIGVVAFDVRRQRLGYHLQKRARVARVNRFFPNLPDNLFEEAWDGLRAELDSLEIELGMWSEHAELISGEEGTLSGLFDAVVSPRGGVFVFAARGRMLADSMREALERLRERFVDQQHIKPQPNVEGLMAKSLIQTLWKAHLLPRYELNAKVGPEEFQVPFSLARMESEGRATKALRPLNFNRATPTEIFNHGDEWTQRLRRLAKVGYRPDQCLITYRQPARVETLKYEAFLQLEQEFLGLGVEFVEETQTDKIIDFAAFPEPPDLSLL